MHLNKIKCQMNTELTNCKVWNDMGCLFSIFLVGARGIAGKNLYVPDPNKPKPFNYRKYDYNPAWQIFDKTTLRLDENSKLVSWQKCSARMVNFKACYTLHMFSHQFFQVFMFLHHFHSQGKQWKMLTLVVKMMRKPKNLFKNFCSVK